MTKLDKPIIFVFNFGSVLSIPDLDRLADSANAQWVCYECPFAYENEHAEQIRYTLRKAHNQIMEYAETGVEPDQ